MLRIATNQVYDRNIFAMQRAQTQMHQTQLQVASGRKMVVPSDDPVRAARSLELQQSQSVNQQFLENIGYAKDVLGLTDTRLTQMSDTLQYLRDKFVQAGTGALTASDRAALAQDLRSQLANLVGLANSQDGQGNYLFGGFKNDRPPIAWGDHDGNPVTPDRYYYQGDANVKQMQVGAARRIDANVPGSSASGPGGLFDADQSTFVAGPPTQYPLARFFNDLQDAIDALDPATAGATTIHAASAGIAAVDRFLARVQQYTAKVGSQLAELDALTEMGKALDLDYAQARSRIEDLDYTEALSRLAQQQMVLSAAQQSFVKVSNLSLFQYL
ncbi:flagellar hook-associated protein FlgL [Hydrogenophilus thiooxidans]|uniref:flagellar hook-associated protein FlgL n=1 Tax=Hydrogenophilus thiooxidans TaxID=2820326 RepID=UPI001C227EA5|nr:flagellar hook-associated protein FlgL [Hydrogenophilus thiooxidans]